MEVGEQLRFFASLYGVPDADARREIGEWLDRFRIPDYLGRRVEELSKGNQQKIQFLAAILHDPEVLIMDEPFTGLDPVNVRLLKEAFLEMKARGKTLIFSTHQMETVEELCETIAIVDQGRVVVSGTVRDVKRAMHRQVVRLATDGDDNGAAWLADLPGVRSPPSARTSWSSASRPTRIRSSSSDVRSSAAIASPASRSATRASRRSSSSTSAAVRSARTRSTWPSTGVGDGPMRDVFPNALHVARREYLFRVRGRAFKVTTALLALAIVALTLLPTILGALGVADPPRVAVANEAGDIQPDPILTLQAALIAGADPGAAIDGETPDELAGGRATAGDPHRRPRCGGRCGARRRPRRRPRHQPRRRGRARVRVHHVGRPDEPDAGARAGRGIVDRHRRSARARGRDAGAAAGRVRHHPDSRSPPPIRRTRATRRTSPAASSSPTRW